MNPSSFTAIMLAAALNSIPASSFVHSVSSSRVTTHLNLENRIADMIDGEATRLQNIELWRRQEAEKLRKGKEPSIPQGFDFNSVDEFQPNAGAAQKIQMRKDKRMARDDPARYCADRCVATGNCQVWEDMFEMAADEVQQFCTDCVLSEDEEPCNVPEKFIENAGKNSWELAP
mmetsp:Transcript_37065/g.66740  ORF Transcript_37065/g.66740 Transcript_37065/m.66740 type:complete len:174 (-) Transcript_37065:349-870(-)|eukprot:CAMPEP_0201865444 /NCGR_PEP_ID=MMETSP0902-20130614/320_1 /ASSEMBLY_ACC=CAM_ASM_000551 /TAXON_ID=420261 /ORGANISM="Thalassiosira antarctica, Strain CCMP982" /LENGTH=173 /DNA_ID=CAMNT_0048390189 /DNA_START=88 /DNA_END=609 /DNA_ORIENTATION=-